jgi:hypothetical protein
MWQSLRHPDLQITANLIHFVEIDAPVNHRLASGADANEIAAGCRNTLIISHAAGRILRRPAPETIDLTRLAFPLVSDAALLEEVGQIAAMNEHRPPLVNRWQASPFDPIPNRIAVTAKQSGDLFGSVVTVNFDEPMVRVTFALATRSNLIGPYSGRVHAIAFRLASIRRCNQS